MIRVYLNAKLITIVEDSSLEQFLNDNYCKENFFAVAINRKFVPRSQYGMTLLNDGDCVEIVSPMQGG